MVGGIWMVGATCTVYEPEKYMLLGPSGLVPDDVLMVTASPVVIPADGSSLSVITARIDPNAAFRTIVFETSLGQLLGSESDGKVAIAADAVGTAVVDLESGTRAGTARVSAAVMLGGAGQNGESRTFVQMVEVVFATVDGS